MRRGRKADLVRAIEKLLAMSYQLLAKTYLVFTLVIPNPGNEHSQFTGARAGVRDLCVIPYPIS